MRWANQPFYTVLLDLKEMQARTPHTPQAPTLVASPPARTALMPHGASSQLPGRLHACDVHAQAEEAEGTSQWRWKWPSELAAWDVNHYKDTPAPLYLPEDALTHDVRRAAPATANAAQRADAARAAAAA